MYWQKGIDEDFTKQRELLFSGELDTSIEQGSLVFGFGRVAPSDPITQLDPVAPFDPLDPVDALMELICESLQIQIIDLISLTNYVAII